jgi:hypothetical protein
MNTPIDEFFKTAELSDTALSVTTLVRCQDIEVGSLCK